MKNESASIWVVPPIDKPILLFKEDLTYSRSMPSLSTTQPRIY